MARRKYRSTNISVDVDIDLIDYIDEFDTEDLIEEINDRTLDVHEIALLNSGLTADKKIERVTVLDEIKIEIVMNGFREKSLEELEEFFKQ